MPGDRAAELGQLYLDEDPKKVKPPEPTKEPKLEDPTPPKD